MDARQVALGMTKASEYFEKQRREAEKFWELAAKVLAKRLQKQWLGYLQEHGVAEVEDDFIERYRQMVFGAGRSEAFFLEWVQEQVEAGEPLVPWIKARSN